MQIYIDKSYFSLGKTVQNGAKRANLRVLLVPDDGHAKCPSLNNHKCLLQIILIMSLSYFYHLTPLCQCVITVTVIDHHEALIVCLCVCVWGGGVLAVQGTMLWTCHTLQCWAACPKAKSSTIIKGSSFLSPPVLMHGGLNYASPSVCPSVTGI